MRRTKILATLGPATFSRSMVERLLAAGANGVRFNFSHGDDAQHRDVLRRVRSVADRAKREVAVVCDVQGPKIRLGGLHGGRVQLRDGQRFVLDTSGRTGNERRASVSLPELREAAPRGASVLLGDGSVALRVERSDRRGLLTRVEHGGAVSERAGVYLPGARLRTDILGTKDLADLSVALEEGTDYVALSFVRDASDVRTARRAIAVRADAADVGIIAKIERAEALRNIDGILDEADAIMVARGDLGIEIPLERIASEQKRLIRLARQAGKPVIVATQMLESMVTQPRPTRAEATDVANAVWDGADVVMLSEESAVGRFPVESVEWLDRIAREAERARPGPADAPDTTPTGPSLERAVAESAVGLARRLEAAAIVTPTHTGRTAERVASERPSSPVWALASAPRIRRRLSLVWGVEAFECVEHLPLDALRDLAARLARESPVPLPGRRLVLTAGYPVEGRPTNLVTVIDVPPAAYRRGGLRRPRTARASAAAAGKGRGSGPRTRAAAAARG